MIASKGIDVWRRRLRGSAPLDESENAHYHNGQIDISRGIAKRHIIVITVQFRDEVYKQAMPRKTVQGGKWDIPREERN